MNIIHIGLGKTGSTTLQENIFPKLSEKIGYKYWVSDENILDKVKVHYAKLVLKETNIKKIDIFSKFLISHEGLSGFNEPESVELFAENNLKAFGNDAHILITVREPLSYLKSIYFEFVLKKLIVCSPKDFFDVTNPYCNFDIKKFSYERLISEYNKRFKKVTIIKMEKYDDINYLSKKLNIKESILSQVIGSKNEKFQIKNVSYHLNVYKISLLLSFLFYPLKTLLRFSVFRKLLKKKLIHFINQKFSEKNNKKYPNFYLNISIRKLEQIENNKLIDIIFSQIIAELFKKLKIFNLVNFINGIFFIKRTKDSLKLNDIYTKDLDRLVNEYQLLE